MARSLADMIDDDTMEGMAISAGQKGTNGHQIAEMYGISRPEGPESLRARLREELGDPPGGMVATHVEDYHLNAHADRVIRMKGVDPVHLRALAIWADEPLDVEIDDRVSLTVHANKAGDRLGVTIRLGPNHEALWEFDEDADGPDGAGSIEVMDHPLPATVLVALAGKTLESALSQPVTDGAGLVITEAIHYDANNSTYLRLQGAGTEPKEAS